MFAQRNEQYEARVEAMEGLWATWAISFWI